MATEPVFPKRLKEARLRAGISQKRLGILAGIDEFSASPRINQYERGRHTPDLGTAERLAAALGIPAVFLYCRDAKLAELLLCWAALSRSDRVELLRKASESLAKRRPRRTPKR
jgi:transcriptional regulator with XRE-family HTH domain